MDEREVGRRVAESPREDTRPEAILGRWAATGKAESKDRGIRRGLLVG